MNPKISLIAPAHNEAGNLPEFIKKSYAALKKITSDFEIIIVDDGSTDNSFDILKTIKKKLKPLKIIRLRRRSGQTAALMAGFNLASKDIVVVLDSDLQQDPKDIKLLVSQINSEIDVVSGSRPQRKRKLTNRIISFIERQLIRWFLGVNIQDTNVSPNAYKKEALCGINLFGEMHRYLIPILAWRGYQIKTIPVSLKQRKAGQSKYKHTKAIKGFLDLFVVKFWQDYSSRPIHFFGGIGIALVILGFLVGLMTIIRKFIFNLELFNVSLLLLSISLTIVGIQIFILGILADIMVKIYYKETPNYQIKNLVL